MTKKWKNCFIQIIVLTLIFQKGMYAQDVNVKIGMRESIQSEILQENRTVLVHVPENYKSSNKTYPVIYRLDGDTSLLLETVSTVNRLVYGEEIAPEMIIVAIENTNRGKDMWPTHTMYYPESQPLRSEDFLEFIEKELIPYIDNKYRTTENKILCGQSLSAVFTLYALLTKPELFNSYIAISGAFPGCENFFKELSLKSFQQANQFHGQNIFITNGLKDELDPDGAVNQSLIDFSALIKNKLGDKINYKHLTYKNDGHVPYHSFYDGLKFIYNTD